MSSIKIGLVDDHTLFRGGLKSLLSHENNLDVIVDAESGEELLKKLTLKENIPDILLCDIKMDGMMGYELTTKLKKSHPQLKVLALSMYVDEASIIKMVKAGANGYILKGAEPWELIRAINDVNRVGFYFGEESSGALVNQTQDDYRFLLKETEIEFLKLCCSELNYKEIAAAMDVSPRTVDGYRERVFPRIQVKTRVGAVIYAFKQGIFKINE